MTYKVRLTTNAVKDITTAKAWYNDQQTGLGEVFIKNVKAQLDGMNTNLQIEYRKVFDEIRKIGLKRFPFSIYYVQNSKNFTIDIIAVLHNKQDALEKLASRRQ